MKRIGFNRNGIVFTATACLVALAAVEASEAQRGGRGPRLSPEDMKKAATIEAATIARELGLNEDTSAQLEKTYMSARKSYVQNMPEVERGPGAFQVIREHQDAEAAKLRAELAAFLDEKQVEKAMSTLGVFNRQWDVMALTADGFDLADDSAHQAQAHIAGYVAAVTKVRDEAMGRGDFQAVRQAMSEEKSALDEHLAKILSDEQMTEWSEKTTPRRRGGARRGQ